MWVAVEYVAVYLEMKHWLCGDKVQKDYLQGYKP